MRSGGKVGSFPDNLLWLRWRHVQWVYIINCCGGGGTKNGQNDHVPAEGPSDVFFFSLTAVFSSRHGLVHFLSRDDALIN